MATATRRIMRRSRMCSAAAVMAVACRAVDTGSARMENGWKSLTCARPTVIKNIAGVVLLSSQGHKMKALTKDRSGRKLNKQPARDRAVARFIETVDFPRLEYILASDSRYHLLLQMMNDPLLFDHGQPRQGAGALSFASVMRKAGVDLEDLQKAYLYGSKQLCMLEMANRLPAIGASVAENAVNHDESCPSCHGSGGEDGACSSCRGSGIIRVMGDKHAIDTIGKWLELDGARGGIMINNLLSQNANFGGGQDRIEDLLARTAQVVQLVPKNE